MKSARPLPYKDLMGDRMSSNWRKFDPLIKAVAVMFSVLLILSYAAGLSHQLTAPKQPKLAPLRFREDGTFHISVFSDLHLGMYANAERGPKQDAKSIRVIGGILDAEKPDFVVINGDLINGDSVPLKNGTQYIDQIVKPMVDRNLTWGSTYGNHDHQPNLDSNALFKRERTWPGCRTQKMVCGKNAGTTNYYLPVYPADCDEKDCGPELILWFFDSRGGYYFQQRDSNGRPVHHPNWVDKSVVEWYQKTNTYLQEKYDKLIPSLAFVHIPVNTTVVMQTQRGIDEHRQPGINDEVPASPQAQGWCEDGHRDWSTNCNYGGQDVPLIRALAGTPGLMGLFSGHDHGNSWCYRWEGDAPGSDIAANGLNLCFGQHTGYGGYGDWIRGSREIMISQEKLKDLEIDSHIRYESGKVVGEISLNATYNQDSYPKTPNDKSFWWQ